MSTVRADLRDEEVKSDFTPKCEISILSESYETSETPLIVLTITLQSSSIPCSRPTISPYDSGSMPQD